MMRGRLLTWATYQPGPLFWAARVLARLLPGERSAAPSPSPEDRIRAAFAALAGRELSATHAGAVDYLIADVKRSAAQ